MFEQEFQIRLEILAKSIPAKADGHAQLKAYVAEAIAELEEHLEQVEALAVRNRALARRAARVDRTTDGARLLQYAQAQDRSFHAALRRLELLQKPRRPGPAKGPRKAEPPAADGGTAGPGVPAQDSGPCHPSNPEPAPAPGRDGQPASTVPAAPGTAGDTSPAQRPVEPLAQPGESAENGAPGAGTREKLTVEAIFGGTAGPPVTPQASGLRHPVSEAASEPARSEPPEKLTVEAIFDGGTAGPAVTTQASGLCHQPALAEPSRSDPPADGPPPARREVSTLGLGGGPETCGLPEGGVGSPAPNSEQASTVPAAPATAEKLTVEAIFDGGTAGPAVPTQAGGLCHQTSDPPALPAVLRFFTRIGPANGSAGDDDLRVNEAGDPEAVKLRGPPGG
jgi:hypothetical protein